MFRSVSIVVSLSALTACAGGSTLYAGVPASNARMDATGCGKSVVYVTSYNNSVYIYDQMHNSQTPCGQITGVTNPQGLFVDKKRNLWVAVSGNCKTQFSSVLEFAPGNSTPIKTLQDPAGSATDVAVDNASGTVYVTNFFDYSQGCASGNNGAVEVYANGSTSPTSTLTDPKMTYAFNDSVDDKGNLYVTYLDVTGISGTGRIDEWSGGSGSPTDLGITLQAPGGIETTANGALLVCDQSVACGDFEPGSTTMTNLFATKTPVRSVSRSTSTRSMLGSKTRMPAPVSFSNISIRGRIGAPSSRSSFREAVMPALPSSPAAREGAPY